MNNQLISVVENQGFLVIWIFLILRMPYHLCMTLH